MTNKETYLSLPKEVLSVGHRIGLTQRNDKSLTKSLFEKVLPKNLSEDDFRYTTYLLDEKHNEFNKREKQKKKKNCLSLTSKQRKLLFQLNKSDVKYETFQKINDLWHKYIDSIINEIKTKNDEIKLIRADFHGSYFVVYSSKNPTLVGIKGYVIQETKNTIKIVNKDNRLLVVPKEGTVFSFEHNNNIYKLNGNNMIMSSHHRSKVKPKIKLNEILIDF